MISLRTRSVRPVATVRRELTLYLKLERAKIQVSAPLFWQLFSQTIELLQILPDRQAVSEKRGRSSGLFRA